MTGEVRSVTPERTHESWTVIAKGVAAGEKVVTDGQLRLAPGAKVEIKNAPSQEGTSIKSQITNTK
jgi:multidrug efflux system membrane fusion protein